MHLKKRRALTWTLVGLGIAIVALGTALFLTMPPPGYYPGPMHGRGYWQPRGGDPQADIDGTDGPGAAPGAGPRGGKVFAPWGPNAFGRGHRGMSGGPHMIFGIFFVGVIVLIGFLVARPGFHHPGRFDGTVRGEDAVSLLRREFAEGRVSEEEYRKRLAALRE
ncbi:MAG: hypothetical protein NT080_00240 [Spirochaetes bacterium]|nr:hypothetical protein [Spirochaetota bacterium]